MGIYIKGMEMPDVEHGVRTINIYADGVVTNYAEETIGEAIPVPPHGRLGDLDVLFEFVESKYKVAKGEARKAYSDVLDFICAAGDIIPAEEGEI